MNRHAQGSRHRPQQGEGDRAVGLIAQLYGLTTAERHVLSGVVGIGSVRGVAIALNVAEATVKSHLQKIFGKTGVRRQVDLVKLVAGASEGQRNSTS